MCRALALLSALCGCRVPRAAAAPRTAGPSSKSGHSQIGTHKARAVHAHSRRRPAGEKNLCIVCRHVPFMSGEGGSAFQFLFMHMQRRLTTWLTRTIALPTPSSATSRRLPPHSRAGRRSTRPPLKPLKLPRSSSGVRPCCVCTRRLPGASGAEGGIDAVEAVANRVWTSESFFADEAAKRASKAAELEARKAKAAATAASAVERAAEAARRRRRRRSALRRRPRRQRRPTRQCESPRRRRRAPQSSSCSCRSHRCSRRRRRRRRRRSASGRRSRTATRASTRTNGPAPRKELNFSLCP